MFFGGAAISSCCVFIGFFSALFSGTEQTTANHLRYRDYGSEAPPTATPSLQCYVCNSAYDPRCGDPFNPYSIGVINCTDRAPPEHLRDYLHLDRSVEPVVCRKMVQKVEGQVRVVRSCGYIRDSHDDKKCYRRTGTTAVEVIHCSCTSRLCNSGPLSQNPSLVLVLVTVAITIAITSLLGRYSSS